MQQKRLQEVPECVEQNFLMQLMSEPAKGDTPLTLLIVNREGLVGDVMAEDCLGHNDTKLYFQFS